MQACPAAGPQAAAGEMAEGGQGMIGGLEQAVDFLLFVISKLIIYATITHKWSLFKHHLSIDVYQ